MAQRRRKSRKRISSKHREGQSQSIKKRLKQIFQKKVFLKRILSSRKSIAAMIGFVATLYVFAPKVSLYPGHSLDPYNPFKTVFVIDNKSIYNVNDIEFLVKYKKVQLLSGWRLENLKFLQCIRDVEKINPQKKTYIKIDSLTLVSSRDIKNAFIRIHLQYQLPLINYTVKDRFQYKVERNIYGQYRWFEYEN